MLLHKNNQIILFLIMADNIVNKLGTKLVIKIIVNETTKSTTTRIS